MVQLKNGVNNLNDAIIAAADERLSGVFLVFHHKIIKGTRAFKRSSINKNAFISCNYPYVGVIKDRSIVITEGYSQVKSKDCEEYHHICKKQMAETPKIFLLKIVPGIDAAIFDYIKEEYADILKALHTDFCGEIVINT